MYNNTSGSPTGVGLRNSAGWRDHRWGPHIPHDQSTCVQLAQHGLITGITIKTYASYMSLYPAPYLPFSYEVSTGCSASPAFRVKVISLIVYSLH